MNFEALQRRVKRAETVVSIRSGETGQHWNALRQVWRESWTPLRIITVGLAGGFLAGKMGPRSAKLQGARWLQLIGPVSSLVASAQAAFASLQAKDAADTAEQTVDRVDEATGVAPAGITAAAAASAPAGAPRPVPAAVSPSQPQPAEAATDMSER